MSYRRKEDTIRFPSQANWACPIAVNIGRRVDTRMSEALHQSSCTNLKVQKQNELKNFKMAHNPLCFLFRASGPMPLQQKKTTQQRRCDQTFHVTIRNTSFEVETSRFESSQWYNWKMHAHETRGPHTSGHTVHHSPKAQISSLQRVLSSTRCNNTLSLFF